jgi:hypothetical protein
VARSLREKPMLYVVGFLVVVMAIGGAVSLGFVLAPMLASEQTTDE